MRTCVVTVAPKSLCAGFPVERNGSDSELPYKQGFPRKKYQSGATDFDTVKF